MEKYNTNYSSKNRQMIHINALDQTQTREHQVLDSFRLNIVLPAKNDSDVMFVYKVIRDLESIDSLRIGLIHM